MTSIDKTLRSHGKTLTLAFSAIVVAATAATFFLPTSEPYVAKKKNLSPPPPPPPNTDPANWTTVEIRDFLKSRYVYPADDATREQLISLAREMCRTE